MLSSPQPTARCEAQGASTAPLQDAPRLPGSNAGPSFLSGSRLAHPSLKPAAGQARREGRRAVAVEANLFSRVVRIAKSYADAVVTAAEDPEKLLEQTVKEMQEDLIKMKQTSASVIASQKMIQVKYEQAQGAADDWYRRADLALEKGDEELAREALKRKRSYQESADGLKKQLEYQADAVQTLIANTRKLEGKLAESKSKKDTLKARAQSAKASKAVNEMVGSLSTSTASAAFDRMEEKVLQMEAQSEATEQLVMGDDVEGKFAALEGGSVEDELKDLKTKKLSGSGVRGQLPEGRPIKDALDVELDDLRRKARE